MILTKYKLNNEEVSKKYSEYLKCKSDHNYFILNYVLLPEVGGNAKFKLYNKQEEFLQILDKEKHVIVLKTRQVGASTLVQAYITWMCTFFDNVVVGVISRDGPECTDFSRKIIAMIEGLPDWIRPKFEKKTEQSFILQTGAKLFTGTVNPAKPGAIFRGKSISFLVIDEAAYISYLDEAYTGIAPSLFKSQTVAKSKSVPYGTVIISTPNGVSGDGEWYFNRIKEARVSGSVFTYFEMHWKQIPEFANDPNWYNQQCKMLNNDPRKIAQELNMVFLGSRDSVLSDSAIEKIQQYCLDPINKKHLLGGELWVFKEMNVNSRYLIGVDTATKAGKCHSSICVVEFETLEQVAEYQGDIEVTDFSRLVMLLMDMYPNNIAIVEVESYGNQVVETLKRNIKYQSRLFKKHIKDKFGKIIEYRYGFETNSKTRPLIMESIITYLEDFPYIVKSKRLATELIELEEKNGKIKGRHTDDLVLALGFCLYTIKYNLTQFISVTDIPIEEIEAMREVISDETDTPVLSSYTKLYKQLKHAD